MADLLPPAQIDSKSKSDEKVDYSNLPCPIPYEQLHREAFQCLKGEYFQGLRVDLPHPYPFYQKVSLSHSVMMFPAGAQFPLHYQIGASYFEPKWWMLIGSVNITTDGRLSVRAKADLTDNLSVKAKLEKEQHMSPANFNVHYKGSDYRAQLQFGNYGLFGTTYIKSVTPHLSLGGEVFSVAVPRKDGIGCAAKCENDKMSVTPHLSQDGEVLSAAVPRKYGIACAARYENDKMVASAQLASTGAIVMNYVQKVSEKVSLATDFVCNWFSRDVTASVGYDFLGREGRVRAKIDSNLVSSCLYEHRVRMGLHLLVSAELDHNNGHKCGLGLHIRSRDCSSGSLTSEFR